MKIVSVLLLLILLSSCSRGPICTQADYDGGKCGDWKAHRHDLGEDCR